MELQGQRVRVLEMLVESAELPFQDVLIFTVTNNIIRMPVSLPTFAKCFVLFFNIREERGGAELHSWPTVPSCPCGILNMTFLLPENSTPGCTTQRSEFTTEWMSGPRLPEPAHTSSREPAVCIAPRSTFRDNHVGSLKLVTVDVLIPEKPAGATSQGFFFFPRQKDLRQTYQHINADYRGNWGSATLL